MQHTTHATTTSAPPASSYRQIRMRSTVIDWLWTGLNMYGAFWIWLFTLPYNTLKWGSPNALEPYVLKAGAVAQSWLMPIVNLIQNLTYAMLSTVDAWTYEGWTGVQRVHHSNMKHFSVAMEAYMRLIEQKAHIIEKHGLRGIPEAFGAKAA